MRAAVAELKALAVPLEKAGGVIRLDMTLAGEMEYYNGLVFQGYLKALPRPLLKGGRYDLLMQKFTPGAGAIGFAVYLDELDRLSAPLPPVQKNSTDRVMLNVALPKGRLGDKVYNLLAGIGYGCPEDYNATRKLVVETRRPASATSSSSPATLPSMWSTALPMWASWERTSSQRLLPMCTSCWTLALANAACALPPRPITRTTPAARCGGHQIRQHCKELLRIHGTGHRYHQAERLH